MSRRLTVSSPDEIGIIIVDHGSRRAESNDMLPEIVSQFVARGPYAIVEPAHMELAEPTIDTAFDRCVARGARRVILFPYFLLPGRHWSEDIPSLARQAAARHPQVEYLVPAPLGIHPLMSDIILDRIDECTEHASGTGEACPLCAGTDRCQFQRAK